MFLLRFNLQHKSTYTQQRPSTMQNNSKKHFQTNKQTINTFDYSLQIDSPLFGSSHVYP